MRVSRLLVGTAALGAWSTLLLLFVRERPNPIALLAAGAAFTVPLISLWEWLVHGLLYHRGIPGFAAIRRIHSRGHHAALFPPERYVQHGPYAFMRIRSPMEPWRMTASALDNALTCGLQVALHGFVGLWTILLPAWLATNSRLFLASCAATLALVSWLLAYVHGCIHTPKDRWVERRRWFQWLDRHHYLHHIDPRANLNFLLPLCDLLFGTIKRRPSEREAASHPPFEWAKPMAKDVARP